MKTADKFLLGIVVGIVILVIVVFAVAFFRPKPAYLPEDTPGGVAHNYLLALRQKDFKRAYSYLSPTIAGYPATQQFFVKNIRTYNWSFRLDEEDVALTVTSASISGNRAIVKVHETRFSQIGLFGEDSTRDFEMQLQYFDQLSSWKIVEADSYWNMCWNKSGGCD